MKSLRIAHIADTHLGYKYSLIPDRDDDFRWSWLYACHDIVRAAPDLIIHAGDVFHTHRPDWKALTGFSQGLDILKSAEVPIFIIAGNHDTSGIPTQHTVFTFTSNVYPQVVSTNDILPSVHHIASLDTDVVLVPHRALLNPYLPEKIYEIIDGLTGYYSILVSHGGITKEDNPSEAGSIAIPHAITEYPWDYMAFGHLHLAQPYGRNGWYSGSTERCGWSDFPASPAWTLVDLGEDKVIRHSQRPIPHMAFIEFPELDAKDLSPVDVVFDLCQYLDPTIIPRERCHIRVKILNISYTAKKQVETLFRKALSKEYPAAVFTIKADSDLPGMLMDYDATKPSELKPLVDMFKDFVAERQYTDTAFRERFLDKGLDLLSRRPEEDNNAE